MKEKTRKEAHKVISFMRADMTNLLVALDINDKKGTNFYAEDLAQWLDELNDSLEED